jgi:hypothetical protein
LLEKVGWIPAFAVMTNFFIGDISAQAGIQFNGYVENS